MTATFSLTGDLEPTVSGAPATPRSAYVELDRPVVDVTNDVTYKLKDRTTVGPEFTLTGLPAKDALNNANAAFNMLVTIGVRKWVVPAQAAGSTHDLTEFPETTGALATIASGSVLEALAAALAAAGSAGDAADSAAAAAAVGSVLVTENGDGTIDLTVAGGSAWTVVDNGDGTANLSLAGQSATIGPDLTTVVRSTDGSAFADLGKEPGVDPTGVTECAGAINTALAAHKAAGKRTYARGTFKIGSQVTIAHNVDMADALFNYVGSGTAVVIGTTTLGAWVERLHVVAPKVDNQSSGLVGIEVCNLASSYVEIPYVRIFQTNLLVSGRGQGNVHNTFMLGELYNATVNLRLWADATGWSNSNLYLGGRFQHSSGFGSNVIGCHHIQMAMTTNKINCNLFLNPSLEGSAPQYHVAFSGLWNVIMNGRWECPGGARVRWELDATENRIVGGYEARAIVETNNALAQPGGNTIEHGRRNWRTGSSSPNGAVTGMVGDLFTNENGGAGATLWVKESGAQTNTGWVSK